VPASPLDPAADERARRVNRGCWIALLSGLALLTIAAVVVAVAINRLVESSSIPEWGRKVGEGADIMLDAQSAPGVRQMRELGCTSAMILDLERLYEFLETLADGGSLSWPPNPPAHAAVCTTQGGSPPSCEQVARAIARHGRLRGEVGVVVSDGDARSVHSCAERYDAAGKHLGPFDAKAVPVP
jgi:hypothetical protein